MYYVVSDEYECYLEHWDDTIDILDSDDLVIDSIRVGDLIELVKKNGVEDKGKFVWSKLYGCEYNKYEASFWVDKSLYHQVKSGLYMLHDTLYLDNDVLLFRTICKKVYWKNDIIDVLVSLGLSQAGISVWGVGNVILYPVKKYLGLDMELSYIGDGVYKVVAVFNMKDGSLVQVELNGNLIWSSSVSIDKVVAKYKLLTKSDINLIDLPKIYKLAKKG